MIKAKFIVGILAGLALAACGSAVPDQESRLVFESYRDGNAEVYVINLDGSGAVNLTQNDAYDGTPSVAPDGLSIAFTSERAGSADIFIMDSDGDNVRQLTEGGGNNTIPAWAPDGQRILFVSNRTYNIDVQGGHIEVPGNSKIWVMNADGSNPSRITQMLGLDMFGTWSPDGLEIAFMSVRDGNPEIYRIREGGAGQNLTNDPANDMNPSWSPDRAMLAFMSDRSGDSEIYLLDLETDELINITNAPESNESDPAWSPDGEKLAFISDRDGNIEVYVMNADGSNWVRVTNNPAKDLHPEWLP